VRSEEAGALARCLEELPAADREVVVLRAFEQLPNHRVAALVGATPNATSLRYNRALAALRERLPGSIVEELARPDLPDAAADPGAPTPENPRNP
jgi:DNA-directed RNA polymerase specialized sigma24 family protein